MNYSRTVLFQRLWAGPSPEFSSRGGQKNRRGSTFLKYSIGCMQQPVGQTWNGVAPITNGVAGHHCPPRWRRPWLWVSKQSWKALYTKTFLDASGQCSLMVCSSVKCCWRLFEFKSSLLEELGFCRISAVEQTPVNIPMLWIFSRIRERPRKRVNVIWSGYFWNRNRWTTLKAYLLLRRKHKNEVSFNILFTL